MSTSSTATMVYLVHCGVGVDRLPADPGAAIVAFRPQRSMIVDVPGRLKGERFLPPA
jgi:hypothetical protein